MARASENTLTQAVYAGIPISLKNLLLRHGVDPSKGFKEFIQEFNLVPSVGLLSLGTAMNTALVLGGGGALGDFELGVLQYLYAYNIRPQIICGTSVGAINAAKLAEGEGTPQETDRGFKGLQNIWLQNMHSPSDMYVKEPAFAALPDDIQGAILSQLAESAAAGLIFGGLFTSILAIFGFGSSDASKVQDFLNSAALYNLSPIETLARQKLSLDLISGSAGISQFRLSYFAKWFSRWSHFLGNPVRRFEAVSMRLRSPPKGLVPLFVQSDPVFCQWAPVRVDFDGIFIRRNSLIGWQGELNHPSTRRVSASCCETIQENTYQ